MGIGGTDVTGPFLEPIWKKHGCMKKNRIAHTLLDISHSTTVLLKISLSLAHIKRSSDRSTLWLYLSCGYYYYKIWQFFQIVIWSLYWPLTMHRNIFHMKWFLNRAWQSGGLRGLFFGYQKSHKIAFLLEISCDFSIRICPKPCNIATKNTNILCDSMIMRSVTILFWKIKDFTFAVMSTAIMRSSLAYSILKTW